MKRRYHLISIILSFASGVVVGYSLFGVPEISNILVWTGGTVSFTWVVNMLLWGLQGKKGI